MVLACDLAEAAGSRLEALSRGARRTAKHD